MDLHEHQARKPFADHGIPVPRAKVTDSPEEARMNARRLGKVGGVKLAADPSTAKLMVSQVLGRGIKGHTVGAVMLAQPVGDADGF